MLHFLLTAYFFKTLIKFSKYYDIVTNWYKPIIYTTINTGIVEMQITSD